MIARVVGEGLIATGAGAAAGTLGAFLLGDAMAGLLFGVTRFDALSFVCALTVLALTAAAACYLPARRAARVDAPAALR